jgi:hypothetical protein
MAEGARFETSAVTETISSNSTPSVQFRSFTEESEAEKEPIKTGDAAIDKVPMFDGK